MPEAVVAHRKGVPEETLRGNRDALLAEIQAARDFCSAYLDWGSGVPCRSFVFWGQYTCLYS